VRGRARAKAGARARLRVGYFLVLFGTGLVGMHNLLNVARLSNSPQKICRYLCTQVQLRVPEKMYKDREHTRKKLMKKTQVMSSLLCH
jgi:hypothetical protein